LEYRRGEKSLIGTFGYRKGGEAIYNHGKRDEKRKVAGANLFPKKAEKRTRGNRLFTYEGNTPIYYITGA